MPLCPLTEQAAPHNVCPTEIRLSLSALQDILDSRMVKKSINRANYIHITGLICNVKYDEEFKVQAASIWELPEDDSCYAAILSALRLEPLSLLFDS